jgi:DNA-binding YbaB/EbfC family protein
MFDRARELYRLQSKARRIQKELRKTEIAAEAADGKIEVIFNGEQKIQSIKIDESMLAPENQKDLENGLKSAIEEAIKQSQKIAQDQMKEIAGDLNLPGM